MQRKASTVNKIKDNRTLARPRTGLLRVFVVCHVVVQHVWRCACACLCDLQLQKCVRVSVSLAFRARYRIGEVLCVT